MHPEERFRAWLKERLAQPGRSQSGLARYLGLDSSAVNRLVNGKRDLKVREVEAILRYLRETAVGKEREDEAWSYGGQPVSLNFLLGENGEPREDRDPAPPPGAVKQILDEARDNRRMLYTTCGVFIRSATLQAIKRVAEKGAERILEALEAYPGDDLVEAYLHALHALDEITASDLDTAVLMRRLDVLARRQNAGVMTEGEESAELFAEFISARTVGDEPPTDTTAATVYQLTCLHLTLFLETGNRDELERRYTAATSKSA